jgi:hypothetical protein
MFKKLLVILSMIVITGNLASGVAYASSLADTYGFSAPGMSMGNAMASVVNDWSSVYYNIAGLGKTLQLSSETAQDLKLKLEKADMTAAGAEAEPEKKSSHPNQIGIFYMYTLPMLKINIPQRTSSTTGRALATDGDKDLNFGAMVLGVAVDINNIIKMPSIVSSARFGLGLAALGDGSLAKVNDIDLKTHDFLRYGREAQCAVIIAGMGFGFLKDTFGIGGGARIAFTGQATAQMNNVELGSGEQTPESQTKMDLKAKPTMVVGLYISPGKIVPMLKGLEFGACYRYENYLKIDPFRAGNTVNIAHTALSLTLGILDFYVPHTFTGGVSYTTGKLTIAADAEYQMWSRFKISSSNMTVYERLIATYGDAYELPKLKDIIIPKLGLKFDAIRFLSIMAGYNYQQSFLPKNAGHSRINYLDNDKHIGSAGLQFHIPQFGPMGGPVDITLMFQGQYCVRKTVTKDNPIPEDPSYSYEGFVPSAGIEISMKI